MPGILRGALEMVNMKVNTYFRQDVLRGDATTELRLELLEIMSDIYVDDDEWLLLLIYIRIKFEINKLLKQKMSSYLN